MGSRATSTGPSSRPARANIGLKPVSPAKKRLERPVVLYQEDHRHLLRSNTPLAHQCWQGMATRRSRSLLGSRLSSTNTSSDQSSSTTLDTLRSSNQDFMPRGTSQREEGNCWDKAFTEGRSR
eukprot:270770-Hanusia_phi.AAC.3